MFWAMAKVAPSSFGPATFRPVETAFWVAFNCALVLLRYSSAVMAPELVLTLSPLLIHASVLVLVRERFALGAFCSAYAQGNWRAGRRFKFS
jgi:hypothetical protein